MIFSFGIRVFVIISPCGVKIQQPDGGSLDELLAIIVQVHNRRLFPKGGESARQQAKVVAAAAAAVTTTRRTARTFSKKQPKH